ncbi:MerR family transcriptional regulator [Adlercreutzia sp. ZJ242]|uniref:MerR family transcriptional regulator n=1 Tax=Adlercreutzia sp. ZJ242 TaxID=2709409 RepID=UPI0013EE38AB|nr:MerR family transcriptional regulator [Adlercreutzia sp. ZJ242]
MPGRGYSVHELAKLAGVSVRTLHHYDELGLVRARRAANGYRRYEAAEVDRLHQVLLFRQTGMPLADIRRMMEDPAFDQRAALRRHLGALRAQRSQIDDMIANVEKTLACLEGGPKMADEEKFRAFKRDLIAKNEAAYGAEVRERWGDAAADASNARVMGMSEERWSEVRQTEARVKELLLEALPTGDPTCAAAQEAARLHGRWLQAFWAEGAYSKAAHAALAEGYVADERFRAYYEAWAPGAAEFLRDAIAAYCAK